ncbi:MULTISPECIES: histidine phosphatase family protein [unclassified Saccharopolyspora]|uniref:histidine phosphatase family protein n=1 Tax=unclassified Saccharopolyspora TaxID=2646250 RepID=UPI001CD67DFF|nr:MULTISPECIES: histidine phosphatase family protein [unclassified Saccharopolyspora]MCA1187828.1 histidine phosphatase family protein [Saccharopolyspora sp. 6T]MCA1193810.1 histidine phosphatase family protein [Saccharopolyspora sp. 6V]MCA1227017.1 histidine phosphatase family protein [Saccharopolyspora sp. 6M]MCA1281753.1 histidine phosphatase family protein [Saccharopolyspora sp. 7B]
MTPVLRAPADGLRLVLVRHGQTPSNVAGLLDTLPPGPGLTEQGRRQAADLAERLGTEKVLSVHASRALRAQETALPTATRHGLDVRIADGTHEIFVGDLEGRGDLDARERFDEIYDGWHHGEDRSMPGGETGTQALTRFFASAQPVLDEVTTGAVVLVSHGAMVRLVAARLAPEVEPRRSSAAYLPNTGIIVLEADSASPTGWRCAQWDDLPD